MKGKLTVRKYINIFKSDFSDLASGIPKFSQQFLLLTTSTALHGGNFR